MKKFDNVILTFDLLEYREESHDYKALYNGLEAIVDPYVGCVWKDEDVRLGVFTFEGFWGTTGDFLPSAEL
jgi:hypothetical protein